MKTKKVLALVVLAAMLISILPMAAFGAIDPHNSRIVAPAGSAETTIYYANDASHQPLGAPANWKNTEDSNVFEVVIVDTTAGDTPGGNLYLASSRGNADNFFWSANDDGPWDLITTSAVVYNQKVFTLPMSTVVGSGSGTQSFYVAVQSNTSGTANVVIGTSDVSVAEYTKDSKFEDGSINDIIGQKRTAIEFIAAEPNELELTSNYNSSSPKPANGVDTYTMTAYVTTYKVPAAGKDVTFSIVSGTGATLTATRATTNAAGKAEVKVYSTISGTVEIEAKANNNAKDREPVTFGSTGIVSIKPESADNAKVARNDSAQYKKFNFSAYDAAGNRADFLKLFNATADVTDVTTKMKDDIKITVDIVTKPSGAALKADDVKFMVHSSGNGRICVPISKLTKDGDYEVKIYLANGVSVSYKFSAKDQGEVTKMILSYGASSYSAGTVLPQPEVKYQDAEGYETSESFVATGDLKLSISDASFMDGGMTNQGRFKLKDDKSGTITMTAVNTSKNLVATQVLTIEKAASYLKLTPQSVGAVGGEVSVDIQLVDVDGKLAPSGLKAVSTGTSATVISKPEGAVSSASTIDTSDFNKGKANVKVSSNMEGDVTLQVIITEESKDKEGTGANELPAYGGRTYTGACTVSFGKTTAGGGQIIFIIGSPSYVSGNKAYAAESPAFIENGRTFLGVRDAGSAIGATIEWEQDTNTAILSKDGVIVKITVGANKITVTKGGVTTEIEIDAPAQNKNGRVYLPFRALMEAFNYTVVWDQATQSIICSL